jgi:hypothetical protein
MFIFVMNFKTFHYEYSERMYSRKLEKEQQ